MELEVSALPYSSNSKPPIYDGRCIWLFTEEEMIKYLEECRKNAESSSK